jgi:hypothetical protein
LQAIIDHYRCQPTIPCLDVAQSLQEPTGFFRFGPDVVCYGRAAETTRSTVNGNLFDAWEALRQCNPPVSLPFDLNQVADNLRYERYVQQSSRGRWMETSWVKDIYYRLRPMFPVAFRKHLQRLYLQDWDKAPFPAWPVDRSVDLLLERLAILAMRLAEIDRLPFIWFWPDGYRACAILTHDVETTAGRDFSERLIDIDESFGIKSSFQVVPEKRYTVSADYLAMIRDRGCEVNIHGLDHEGNLFMHRETFLKAAEKINEYAKLFGARGFRSPVLYRNIDWLHELDFSYDMSVPNVARLEAQRGGCCTVMPYFLPGGMLELPLTMAEDYTVFHILKDYSTALWKQQMSLILEGNGLISFIVHPDYVIETRAQDTFKALLEELNRVRSAERVWVPLSGEVDRWWRQRNEMKLVADGRGWRTEGPGSERARVAYACRENDRLVYEFD